MRFIILILSLFLFDYFVFQTVVGVMESQSMVSQYFWYAIYWFFSAGLLGLFLMARLEKPLLTAQQFVLFRASVIIAYVSKFLMVIILLVNGLLTFLIIIVEKLSGQPTGLQPDWWMARIAVTLGGVLFVTLLYGIIRNGYRYRLYKERLIIPDLPAQLEGLRIVQFSDVHSGSLIDKEAVARGIDLINQQDADIVCFTGDLVNNVAEEMQEYIPLFKSIKARYGVYSILGNHDYGDYVRWPDKQTKMLNFKQLMEVHCALNWTLLLNEHRTINIQNSKLAVIGVENYSAKGRFSKYGDLQKACEDLEPVDFKLLLSHDPSHWDAEVVTDAHADIQLTLSGHTHGGQFGIEIGSFKWSPVQYFYNQWMGLYQKGKQYIYVNRGFGFLGYPGRVGILPEITLIELCRLVK